jgi:fatty-acyl-CoA synthase
MDLSSWIGRWAGFVPDKPALICDGEALSYRMLDERIAGVAAGLRRNLSIRRGDRVAFLGANCPEMIVLVFACARLGAMVVPLNWRLAPPENAYILNHCGATALVCEPDFTAGAETYREAMPALRLITTGTADGDWYSFETLGEPAEDGGGGPGVGAETPVLVVYTSGTTGRPKGAVLSQGALFWNAVNSTHMHDLTSSRSYQRAPVPCRRAEHPDPARTPCRRHGDAAPALRPRRGA